MKTLQSVLGLATGLLLGVCASSADAQSIYIFESKEDGSDAIEITCPLNVTLNSNGTSSYTLSGSCGAIESAALNRNPNISSTQINTLVGEIKIKNPSTSKKLYTALLDLPFTEGSVESLLLGGVITRFFQTDANGGTLNALPGTNGMFQLLVDSNEVPGAIAFPTPNQATNGGQGQQTVNYFLNYAQQDANAVFPSEDMNSSIGAVYAFGLTGGDSVKFTTIISAKGDLISCSADLSGDGKVDGADLALLMGSWGLRGPSDLNGDGTTNAADLAELLGAFGDC